MKIFRLSPAPSVSCQDCHNPAEIEVNLGAKVQPLRLCPHDAAYLHRVLGFRLDEIRSRAPIPKPRDEDSRGNR